MDTCLRLPTGVSATLNALYEEKEVRDCGVNEVSMKSPESEVVVNPFLKSTFALQVHFTMRLALGHSSGNQYDSSSSASLPNTANPCTRFSMATGWVWSLCHGQLTCLSFT